MYMCEECNYIWDGKRRIGNPEVRQCPKCLSYEIEETSPADLAQPGASAERISSVVRCCHDTDDILKETVENALYSTGRFTTDQCTDLAEGIIIYIKDSGLKISRQ